MVYAPVVEVRGCLSVGRLGPLDLDGCYLYVGSARGPGGQRRIERHRRIARGLTPVGPWHIDRLLTAGHPLSLVAADTDDRLECALAGALAGRGLEVVPGFGSSDCRCRGHLFRTPCGVAVEVAAAAMADLCLHPRVLPP